MAAGWLVREREYCLKYLNVCVRFTPGWWPRCGDGGRARASEQQRSHSSSAGVCSDTDASGNVRLNHSDQNSQPLRENSGFVSRLGMLGDAMFHLPGQNLNPVRSLDDPGPSSEAADVPQKSGHNVLLVHGSAELRLLKLKPPAVVRVRDP